MVYQVATLDATDDYEWKVTNCTLECKWFTTIPRIERNQLHKADYHPLRELKYIARPKTGTQL